jgi:Druantia protein DruA
VGEHLQYLVTNRQGRPLAGLLFGSAAGSCRDRDQFIGWSAETRRRNLRFLAYNPRYLILPWIHVKLLASHVLGQMARRVAGDWERVYGHPIYFLETFVDPERYRGTCYRAANWVVMGRTTGRGKNDQTHRPNRSIKEVLGYPLVKDFRARLAEAG